MREYRCETCGERFERLELGGADPEVRCPVCGGVRVRRLVSLIAGLGGSPGGGVGTGCGCGGACTCGR